MLGFPGVSPAAFARFPIFHVLYGTVFVSVGAAPDATPGAGTTGVDSLGGVTAAALGVVSVTRDCCRTLSSSF